MDWMSSIFFFFKQKTAYEMRINDWSSDVCSSDLGRPWIAGSSLAKTVGVWARDTNAPSPPGDGTAALGCRVKPGNDSLAVGATAAPCWHRGSSRAISFAKIEAQGTRSEEHTSELQSLMRISSAFFCLKKNKNTQTN